MQTTNTLFKCGFSVLLLFCFLYSIKANTTDLTCLPDKVINNNRITNVEIKKEILNNPFLNLVPSVSIAKFIAGVDKAVPGSPVGNFYVTYDFVVGNTGTVPLDNFQIIENLGDATNLGGAFVDVINTPTIVESTATTNPNINGTYSGTGDLLTGGGLLLVGETFTVRLVIEVDPDNATASVGLTSQANVIALTDGAAVISDLSDNGRIPESNNPGFPGDTGGFDDPTPLTSCFEEVTHACNDHVNVSVNNNCQAVLNVDMFLEGAEESCFSETLYPEGGYFRLIVMDGPLVIEDLDPANLNNFVVGSGYLGQTLTVSVEGIASSNSCWSSFTIEDKAGPTVTCDDVSISCSEALPVFGMGAEALDNCSNATLEQINENTNTDGVCDANTGVIITRTYVAVDNLGNISEPCEQQIMITRVATVDFPEDIAWYCSDVATNVALIDAEELTCSPIFNAEYNALDATVLGVQNPIGIENCFATTGSGVPSVSEGEYCNLAVSKSDETVAVCEGSESAFKIIRTWTVFDWCANEVINFNDLDGDGIQDDNEEDNIQIIKVIDNVAPAITFADDAVVVINANIAGQGSSSCLSTEELPLPIIMDECSSTTYTVFTEIGEAVLSGGTLNIPSPGLGMGIHEITYQATDVCGNTKTETLSIEVVDNLDPTAVCDELTQVALSNDELIYVNAESFDDGSNDNCGIEGFAVRRMTDNCDVPGNTTFGETVVFCCSDILFDEAGEPLPIMVVLQVEDYYGNTNTCMVEVLVEDKIRPVVTCPNGADVSCDSYFNNYNSVLDVLAAEAEAGHPDELNAIFDDLVVIAPTIVDNCAVESDMTWTYDVNTCGMGTITRSWTNIHDTHGNTATNNCEQTIRVYHVNDWSIEFPEDKEYTCGNDDNIVFDEPIVFSDNCELIAIAHEDQQFDIVEDACYKIIRTYSAINWCIYEGGITSIVNVSGAGVGNDDKLVGTRRYEDGGQDSPTLFSDGNDMKFGDEDYIGFDDGIIMYNQLIKVEDNMAPVITFDMEDQCITATTDLGACNMEVTLPIATVEDCAIDMDISYTLINSITGASAGQGTGRTDHILEPNFDDEGENQPYNVIITAVDHCGNQSSIQYDFLVSDCKPPTPYCVGSIIIELMDNEMGGGMGEIWATDFNVGSFDNCTAPEDLEFYISTEDMGVDSADTNLMLTCANVFPMNENNIFLYVVDEAGNVDYCATTLIVESVPGICPAPLNEINIAGALITETGEGIQDATVHINNGTMNMLTDNAGEYSFMMPINNDYSVVPSNDLDYDNGVTTYDLVLIRQHILTTSMLNSPYKIIAADANNSGAVTTSDLIAIRKVILNPSLAFINNTSWRFVDAEFTFPNPSNPWETSFPEVASFNNINSDIITDFVGVKIGDVNGNAVANQFSSNGEERSTGSLIFRTNDMELVSGETYTVDFTAEETSILGYQFTLNFDRNALQFEGINDEMAVAENFGLDFLSQGAITTSMEFATAEKINDEVVFSLTFVATANATLSNVLSISSSITKAEAYSNTEYLDINLVFNNNENSFALHQNMPNPFNGETQIDFNLPTASFASITIADVNGKLIEVIEGDFEKGFNSIKVRDLNANGIYYYQLKTATHSATLKMVVTK